MPFTLFEPLEIEAWSVLNEMLLPFKPNYSSVVFAILLLGGCFAAIVAVVVAAAGVVVAALFDLPSLQHPHTSA